MRLLRAAVQARRRRRRRHPRRAARVVGRPRRVPPRRPHRRPDRARTRPRIAAHAGPGTARHDRSSRDRALGGAHVPARVAPADPRARAAQRRGRGRRLHRDRRVQLAESPTAEFGTANTRVRRSSTDPATRAQDVATLERWFGPVEVIGHDFVRVPGSVERVDVRGQDPKGRYGAGDARGCVRAASRRARARSRSPTGSRARSGPTSATASGSAGTRGRSSASSRTPATCTTNSPS